MWPMQPCFAHRDLKLDRQSTWLKEAGSREEINNGDTASAGHFEARLSVMCNGTSIVEASMLQYVSG